MKKILCMILASLALLLCACKSGEDGKTVRRYDQPGQIPSYMTKLYPDEKDDERYAVLLRRYDESASAVAIADRPGGEMTTVYTLPDDVYTHELTANEGLISFFEITTYSDGSINYALKVIDTQNGNKVHSPYRKTVSDEDELQTRFIVIYGGCVYYLTKSNLLSRCRVMKYSVIDKKLTEYLNFDFTENEFTGGSSCTFISEKSGYLSCGTVEGNRTTVKTYDLKTNELVREKPLPYNAMFVYMTDHDYETGMYAVYYLSAQGDERIAALSYSESDVTDLMSLNENTIIAREEVRITKDGRVYFETQDTTKQEQPYEAFNAVIINAADKKTEKYMGCLDLFLQDDGIYGLCFDCDREYAEMVLRKY